MVLPQGWRTPILLQEPLRRGRAAQFWVTGVRPGEVVSFLFSDTGEGAGPCAVQLGGLCVDIIDPALFGEAPADAGGTATVARTIPTETGRGQTMAFQAVIQRGPHGEQSVKTNAMTARVLD